MSTVSPIPLLDSRQNCAFELCDLCKKLGIPFRLEEHKQGYIIRFNHNADIACTTLINQGVPDIVEFGGTNNTEIDYIRMGLDEAVNVLYTLQDRLR